jgi:2-succinyl-6-hydroxy-2,4-cyclohexadiene-1-carboxylate synthase
MSRIFALHGFTGTEQSFDALKLSSLRCGLLGGHGPSPSLDRADFAAEVVHWLKVVRGQGPSPVHLLGYSAGARIALAMVIAEPAMFSRATLIGVNPGLESESARIERQAWEGDWVQLLEREGLEGFERAWSQQDLFLSQKTLTREVRDAQRRARLSHTAPGLSHAMTNLGLGRMPNLWDSLSKVQVPVQLIVGQNDAKFLAIAERMCSLNHNFQMTKIPGAGHNPVLEFPELVRGLIEGQRL